MIKGAVTEALAQNYTFICNPFDGKATGMALVLWVFYTSKVLDFFDTIFMVLRGKWRQLSFLHVYHHTSIFLVRACLLLRVGCGGACMHVTGWAADLVSGGGDSALAVQFYWLNLNAGYDGDVYYTIVVNSFIHFVMYGYYFLTTLNIPVPTVRPALSRHLIRRRGAGVGSHVLLSLGSRSRCS